MPWCIAVLLVAAAGFCVFMDAIYWHPDPQSPIAVVLTPLLQGIVFLIAAPLVWWAARANVYRSLVSTKSRLKGNLATL